MSLISFTDVTHMSLPSPVQPRRPVSPVSLCVTARVAYEWALCAFYAYERLANSYFL